MIPRLQLPSTFACVQIIKQEAPLLILVCTLLLFFVLTASLAITEMQDFLLRGWVSVNFGIAASALARRRKEQKYFISSAEKLKKSLSLLN